MRDCETTARNSLSVTWAGTRVRFLAPLVAEIASSRLPLSNARARIELGFTPRYPSFREGLLGKDESARFLMRSSVEAAG